MCKLFEVSRSGYYDFVKRLGQPERDAELAKKLDDKRASDAAAVLQKDAGILERL